MMARLEGLEPPAHGLEGRCSIQLSYRRMPQDGFPQVLWRFQRKARLSADRYALYHGREGVSTDFCPFGGLEGPLSSADSEMFGLEKNKKKVHNINAFEKLERGGMKCLSFL